MTLGDVPKLSTLRQLRDIVFTYSTMDSCQKASLIVTKLAELRYCFNWHKRICYFYGHGTNVTYKTVYELLQPSKTKPCKAVLSVP